MSLLSVADALARLLDGVEPLPAEAVDLAKANGRVLAEDIFSLRTQPPFDASAMDGYAVRAADLETIPATLKVIGMSAAGHGFDGRIEPGQAVRIFTGAPVPEGADAILIQEDTRRDDEATVTALAPVIVDRYIRPAGLDFALGQRLLSAGRRLGFRELGLAAAMNHATLQLRRRPKVAVLATGDELVMPGETPGPDQIVASNSFAIAALVADIGGEAIDLGIAADTTEAIIAAALRALDADADILVTLGGASVGDHDLVQAALGDVGFELGFWRIAMRPGKPLMFGTIGDMRVLGLPGNPVSSVVCGLLFLRPLLNALLGTGDRNFEEETAVLGAPVGENDQRQDYLRATLALDDDGRTVATALPWQDSSLLATLSKADALLVRPPFAPAAETGEACRIIRLG